MVKVEIVTPKGISYSVETNMVNIPASDGEMGIMENHMLLLTNLKPGIVYFDGDPKSGIAIGYGFADITHKSVIILTEEATPVGEIDMETQRKLFEEAMKKLANARVKEEIIEWQKKKETAEVFLDIAKRFAPRISS